MKPILFIFLFFGCSCFAFPQNQNAQTLAHNDSLHALKISFFQPAFTKNKPRIYLVSGVHAVWYTGTLITLSQTWYKNYSKASFHIFNDTGEWLQVDKTGHAWTAYSIAHYSHDTWRWAGIKEKGATWLGGISSLGFQTILEYLDGRSAEWGWSWGDMSANVFGSGLFTAQQLLWKEQKIQFKFSSSPKHYDLLLQERADDLFGTNFPTRLLKDYNAQTYWLSANPASLWHANIPKWLNISVGYGAEGLFGGYQNIARDKDGTITFYRPDIKRYRQWYLSPDINWTAIRTNKKFLRTFFSLLNMIKFPAPSLELSNGKIRGHLLSF